MITAISIENFKGIRERVTIRLKPITLVFGANSSGKSTIFHALLYAREVFLRRNLDAGPILDGGVDLGGFRQFVHNHDLRHAVTIAVELDVQNEQLPLLGDHDDGDKDVRELLEYSLPGRKSVVSFSVRWSESRPYVESYSVALNGEHLGCIRSSPGASHAKLELNFEHPLFHKLQSPPETNSQKFGFREYYWRRLQQPNVTMEVWRPDALPNFEERIGITGCVEEGGDPESETLQSQALDSLVSRFVLGPGKILRDNLRDLGYIGPLRQVPQRRPTNAGIIEPSEWHSGNAAWQTLVKQNDQSLLERVNEWLVVRLCTGYRVALRRIRELDSESDLMAELLSARSPKSSEQRQRQLLALPTRTYVEFRKTGSDMPLAPQDLGSGISQLVPVVVACLDPEHRVFCFEQPELHLHPRAACEIGDLIVAGALGGVRENHDGGRYAIRRSIFVETHSEHLVLRILRRIRETGRQRPHYGIAVTPEDVAIYYVFQEDGQSVPRSIGIDEQGEFTAPWPDEFFESDFYERFA